MQKERMNIVIVGHVDHGKSTVIGRLLADTGSLPQGKLQQVKAQCLKNAKPFEYAFLLDALKDEQSQGITIDTARCFFKTAKREYIVLDTPGHVEFLKNMVTGAACADAALLVIDAKEGIQDNSKRHGYLIAMLGIPQVSILVNKMDLVNYDPVTFESIKEKYFAFLREIKVEPISFIPISAREGINLIDKSELLEWYSGPSVLNQLDAFENKRHKEDLPFRFPVQDVYKFTQRNDGRRIFAGTVLTGAIQTNDNVVFYPSGKISTIHSVEVFNVPNKLGAIAGDAIGFTLSQQVYIKPGEIMVKASEEPPLSSTRFRAHIFWMGRAPLVKNRKYKLKPAAARTFVRLVNVNYVMDAVELRTSDKQYVDRHDVAECVFETTKPLAFDLAEFNETTSRFVIVDNYEIAGGGIIIESLATAVKIAEEHEKRENRIYLPVSLDITGKKILLVGGGHIAFQKLKVLIKFTQNIVVIAPAILPDIESYQVECIEKEYDPSFLEGYHVVYACTDDTILNKNIRDDARKQNILVNVVDNPYLSDFISPAIAKDGAFTIAVSSGGTNVLKAIKLRDSLARFLQYPVTEE